MTTTNPTPSTPWHEQAVENLERLAQALTDAGLIAKRFYDGQVPELRVTHPAISIIGLTVTAIERRNSVGAPVWLFYLSTGVLTSPCDDIPAAVQDVKNALRPIYEAVARRAGQ